MKKRISVITPCYNEKENIEECYETIKRLFLEKLNNYCYEHIFCDNSSNDGTTKILRDIANKDQNVKVIINARNFGPGRSTYNGLLNASGDAILMFLPADLQDPPELLPEFVNLWEQGYEIVYGIRINREEKWWMRKIRQAYYHMVSKLSYIDVPPEVGDFQLIDKKVLNAMRQIDDAYPFMRLMTFECGFRSVGISYQWVKRKRGFSKNKLLDLVDQGLNGLIKFTNVPLRLAMGTGLIIAMTSILYAILTLIGNLIFIGKVTAPGIPTLIVALFFFAGIQLFLLGLMGEYLIAIYGQVRKKPLVIERERINFTNQG